MLIIVILKIFNSRYKDSFIGGDKAFLEELDIHFY